MNYSVPKFKSEENMYSDQTTFQNFLVRLTQSIIGKQSVSASLEDKAESRDFRATILDALMDDNYHFPVGSNFHSSREISEIKGRSLIKAIRAFIVDDNFRQATRDLPTKQIRNTLGLPSRFPLNRYSPKALGLFLFVRLLPERSRLVIVKTVLKVTRTREGRSYLFRKFLRYLGTSNEKNLYIYEPSEILLRIVGIQSFQQLNQLCDFEPNFLNAAFKLGFREAPLIIDALRPLQCRIDSRKIFILVDENVIKNDFNAVHPFLDKQHSSHSRDENYECDLRSTICILKDAGIPADELIFLLNENSFDPQHLDAVLLRMKRHGITNITLIFRKISSNLWRIELESLEYVLSLLNVGDSELLGEFSEILLEYRAPKIDIAETLSKLGATSQDFMLCQNFIIKASKIYAPKLNRVEILMRAPYMLDFKELNGCESYLQANHIEDFRFEKFLNLLKQYNLNNKEALLRFGPHFQDINTGELLKVQLGITRQHLQDIAIDDLIEWIKMSRNCHANSLWYLGMESGLRIEDLSSLKKLAVIGSVSPALLKYLVNEQGLRSISKIYKWYEKKGRTTVKYHGGMDYDAAERVLYEDCIKRANFSKLNGNAHALESAVAKWVDTQLTIKSRDCDEISLEIRRNERERFTGIARLRSIPFIEAVLKKREGLLLASAVYDCLSGESVEVVLEKFDPMVNSIVLGKGPQDLECSGLSFECISLVYGVTQSKIQSYWHHVCGFENHTDRLNLDAAYPINLRLQAKTFEASNENTKRAIENNVACLKKAAELAQEELNSYDMLAKISWKHPFNNVVVLNEIWPWFSFILKLAEPSEQIRKWTDHHLLIIDSELKKPRAVSEIERSLSQFIRTTLPDVVKFQLSAFFEDAEFSARTSEFNICIDKRQVTKDELPAAITAIIEFVLGVAARCCDQFKDSLKTSFIGESMLGHAVVSKFPAAFFAKEAFELCSKDDTYMWEEERHSHLLLFDSENKRLVGMAMLYVQSIPKFATNKPCLVVRAINVGTIGHLSFDPICVLDEVMRVAIFIAQKNHLAAVLYPYQSTHFSNQDDILKARYKSEVMKNSKLFSASNNVFYCRQHGREFDAVRELHIAWAASSDIYP